MKNLKVSLKLIVSFMIVIVLAIVIGVMGIIGMRGMQKGASDLYDYNLIAISAMADLRELFNQERSDMRAIFLSLDDPETVNRLISGFSDHEKAAAAAFSLYETTILGDTRETGYNAAKETYLGAFAQMKKDTFALLEKGDFDGAYKIFIDRGTSIIPPITNGLAESTAMNNDLAVDSNKANNDLYRTLLIALVIALLISVGIAVFLTCYISGLISKPLIVMSAFLKKAAETGDINLRLEDVEVIKNLSDRRDELGECVSSCASFVKRMLDVSESLETLADGDLTAEVTLLSDNDTMGLSLQKMIGNLNEMFGEIKNTAVQVSTAAEQIADGAQSLAEGSTDQASVVEELSASVSEISDKTQQNADIAREAADLSFAIKNNAEKGSAQMEQMMQAVKEITDASNQIEKVIKVIDDIAFQTNILALNAAVEAARAGEHGKGFAVVAEEVRNLAAKSAEAARDTGGLIENSIEKANFGLNIATETSGSLKEIVEGINRSAEIVTQIAESSELQASAIAQINTGIDQVAQVVQQNSATAEESAAASEEMSGQSQMLETVVSQFKLKGASKRQTALAAAFS